MTTKTKKAPINLFIDTNVLLGFYRFTDDDIKKLGKLEDLIVKTKAVNLLVTEQQVQEFYRNRDNVIKQGLDQVKLSKLSLPKIFSEHDEYNNIIIGFKELSEKLKQIRLDTIDKALKQDLVADAIVKRIFSKPIETSVEILEKARSRMDIGNPPGKNGSLGDAINWEILLESLDELSDIHIISDDGDYRSPLDDKSINTFLSDEWWKRNTGRVYLYRSLNDFFRDHFPDLELVDEAIKDSLIEQIASSKSFDESRSLITQLVKIGSLSEIQAKDLLNAATTNDQVYKAHYYSPSIVGDKMWDLINPYWHNYSEEEREAWLSNFPDEQTREAIEEL
jgi:hypothetical protein